MTKTRTSYFCQNCGTQYSKWMGQCSSCGNWNTIVEELIQKELKKYGESTGSGYQKMARPLKISAIHAGSEPRINTNDGELNRVLGGGIVPGSVILLGGEPGIGKSTLLLQIALTLKIKVLYVSGEESQKQLKMRADRIPLHNNNCYILTEVKTQNIFKNIEQIVPDIVIIDSVQTLYTDYIEASAGSISQIRACAAEFINFAKETATPVFLIGHITKEGHIAGPKILEHMVDTVLQFEGDRNYNYRILRAHKNRFGAVSGLGVYEMLGNGLREVPNPSELLISHKGQGLSGTTIAATLEGMRSFMIEIQALVSSAVYGTPQRSATGYDLKRLNMLLAILEKRAGFRLAAKDVFLNITGGIRVDDPAIDLAVIAAILSSNVDISVTQHCCFAAEVGLTGEVRPVSRIGQRISEAEKLGFKRIFISGYNKVNSGDYNTIKVIQVIKIEEVFRILFR